MFTESEQPAYVNLTDLANMEKDRQREQSTDSDRTPTDKSPPDTTQTQVHDTSYFFNNTFFVFKPVKFTILQIML